MTKFVGLPNLPIGAVGMNPALLTMISGLKENVDLLTGTRAGGQLSALTRSSFSNLANPAPQKMQQLSATGAGVDFNGLRLAQHDDYVKLVEDVQTLANDVAQIKQELQNLISLLRGQ